MRFALLSLLAVSLSASLHAFDAWADRTVRMGSSSHSNIGAAYGNDKWVILTTSSPAFSTSPTSQMLLLGSPLNLTSAVNGTPVITYQWKKNNVNIATAKSANFSIAKTKAADAGTYTLTATNDSGSTPSTAYVGLVTPVKEGASLVLKQAAATTLNLTCTAVVPTGPAATGVSIGYQWMHGTDILSNGQRTNGSITSTTTGATDKALKIVGLTTIDTGAYTCVVTMTTSAGALELANGDTQVSVVAPPEFNAITLRPYSVSEEVEETLTATGSPKFTASGLPPGVKLDAVTGQLTGKPTAAKKTSPFYYVVKFTATNLAGKDDETVNWTIEELDPTLVGTFRGLVRRHGLTNFDQGGLVQITTANTGAVSGSVTLAGQKYSVAGALVASEGDDPQALLVVKRTGKIGDLILNLTLETNGNRLTGIIRDVQFAGYDSALSLGNGTSGDANGSGDAASFNAPRGIVLKADSSGYVADTGNHTIRAVSAEGAVTLYAGLSTGEGHAEGSLSEARFNSPEGLALDTTGNLYVADTGNHCIRKITSDGVVSTLAGAPASIGATNGTGSSASFDSPCAIAIEPVTSNLFIVDRGNHTIRKVTPDGVVTTVAGTANFGAFKDGAGKVALFNAPSGITYDATLKAFFVTDTLNCVIRKVTPAGAVTTYAGSPVIPGQGDGLLANARFTNPVAIASNGYGTLFVSDQVLVQITSGGLVGAVTSVVAGADAPAAIALEPFSTSILVADPALHSIVRHQQNGNFSGATFSARRAVWLAANPLPAAYEGKFTAAITNTFTADPADRNLPQGAGYATLAVTKTTGAATWAGKTPDGSGLTGSTVVGPEGEVPLHVMLYKNTGSIQGMTDIDITNSDWVDDGFLDWYKIAQPTALKDRTYKAGFMVDELKLIGGKYTPANNVFAFLNLDSGPGNAIVTFSEGNLGDVIDHPLDVTSPSAVKVQTDNNTHAIKVAIAPATGLITGGFNQNDRKATLAGVLVRNIAGNINRGYGHFLLPEDAVLPYTPTTAPILSGLMMIQRP